MSQQNVLLLHNKSPKFIGDDDEDKLRGASEWASKTKAKKTEQICLD